MLVAAGTAMFVSPVVARNDPRIMPVTKSAACTAGTSGDSEMHVPVIPAIRGITGPVELDGRPLAGLVVAAGVFCFALDFSRLAGLQSTIYLWQAGWLLITAGSVSYAVFAFYDRLSGRMKSKFPIVRVISLLAASIGAVGSLEFSLTIYEEVADPFPGISVEVELFLVMAVLGTGIAITSVTPELERQKGRPDKKDKVALVPVRTALGLDDGDRPLGDIGVLARWMALAGVGLFILQWTGIFNSNQALHAGIVLASGLPFTGACIAFFVSSAINQRRDYDRGIKPVPALLFWRLVWTSLLAYAGINFMALRVPELFWDSISAASALGSLVVCAVIGTLLVIITESRPREGWIYITVMTLKARLDPAGDGGRSGPTG